MTYTKYFRLLREKLSSNPCQNQGYILDGYPKTMEQTREIFEIDEDQVVEEEEEIEEEEEEGEKEIKKLILPDFVITLEASDEFLYKRVMSMPENKIQGTHYTEEQMVRRVNEFRANNTEENTLLNIFDEIDIHPIVVNAETDDQDAILALLQHKIGDPKGYPPSAWEIELKRFEEEELMFKQEEEASRIKEGIIYLSKTIIIFCVVEDRKCFLMNHKPDDTCFIVQELLYKITSLMNLAS